jgi:FKBP-type peptidyl-prolyl cis-trans isomerase (trigger factor)
VAGPGEQPGGHRSRQAEPAQRPHLHIRRAGQEQRVWDYYRQNPQAVGALRAPIFEEKVVDFLLELAGVTENKVSREELYKEDDSAV